MYDILIGWVTCSLASAHCINTLMPSTRAHTHNHALNSMSNLKQLVSGVTVAAPSKAETKARVLRMMDPQAPAADSQGSDGVAANLQRDMPIHCSRPVCTVCFVPLFACGHACAGARACVRVRVRRACRYVWCV